MRKFTKPFHGVRDGEIYPTEFAAGDECPSELIAAAESLDALEDAEDEDDAGEDEHDDQEDTSADDGSGADSDGTDAADDKGDDAGTADEKAALQAQLDAAGIKFDKRWGVDKLRAALAEGKKD